MNDERRYKIFNNGEPKVLPFQLGYRLKMYADLEDINAELKKHFDDNDKKVFGKYTFYPLNVEIKEDGTIEATFTPIVTEKEIYNDV